jgi:SH3-like domain-containing protein
MAGALLIGAVLLVVGRWAVAENLGSETKLPIPRFVSLRSNEVNLRTGPGTTYPVDCLPAAGCRSKSSRSSMCGGKFATGGDGRLSTRACWKASACAHRRRRELRSEPAEAGSVVVRLAPGVIGRLLECDAAWCEIDAEGYRGWLKRDEFWGTYPDEKVQ